MAKALETPRPRRTRQPPPAQPDRNRSHLGRVVGAGIAIASATGVGIELNTPLPTPKVCGGADRWSVKVANDPDARAGRIDPNPTGTFSVAQMNQIKPGPLDAGGRMAVEQKQYTVAAYLNFFKHEDDGDYHVVLTDKKNDFTRGKTMVVEFPDAACFEGKHGNELPTSMLGQAIADARATFKDHVNGLSGTHITDPPRVIVTGVGFFDFDHGQKGRSITYPGTDGQGVVFELHPITMIRFPDLEEPD